ncbi:MAG: c-type cytochrome domain-containing protein, partial [Planctomycetaceae bacterium]
MRILLALPLLLLPAAVTAADRPTTPAQLEFFEKKVRPLLARHCYKCHGRKAKSLKGGLRLDQRRSAFKGGDSGAVIVAGQPDKSLLIRSIRYQALEMPPSGKLKPAEIDVLVTWVKNGAAWPSEPSTTPARTPDGRFDISRARKTH